MISLGTAVGQTSITNPEWTFSDDFESATADAFWKDKAYVVRSAQPAAEANHNSKVLLFKFTPGVPEAGQGWSEQRFRIPIEARQLEISYDLYVPANYVHAPRNQKAIVMWSGAYGKTNANIGVSSEQWPTEGGARPSVYLGVDGRNMGHDMLDSRGGFMWHDHQGSWQHIHVYLELAREPGDVGVFEIYRNGVFLTGTMHPYMPTGNDQILYSSRGNFIDQGYLMGWANGGYQQYTEFYIDDFVIKAGSTIGASNLETQVPTNPSGLQVRVTSRTTIELSWVESTDNVGVIGYMVNRNGAYHHTSQGPRFRDAGLVAGSSYSYQLVAYDAAGNVSGASEELSVTMPGPPVLAPIGNRSVSAGDPLQITVEASDPNGDTLQYSATGNP